MARPTARENAAVQLSGPGPAKEKSRQECRQLQNEGGECTAAFRRCRASGVRRGAGRAVNNR